MVSNSSSSCLTLSVISSRQRCTDPIEVTTASVLLSSTFHTTMKSFMWTCVSLATTTVSFLSAKTAPYPCTFLNVFMPNFDFFLSLYPSENKNRNMKHTCKLICVWNSTSDSRGLITYLCWFHYRQTLPIRVTGFVPDKRQL